MAPSSSSSSSSSSGASSSSAGGDSSTTNYLTLNNRVMVGALIILFVVVFFILSLHIYAKWFWQQRSRGGGGGGGRRRSRRRTMGEELFFVDSFEVGGCGLDKRSVEALPVFRYKKGERTGEKDQEDDEDEECAVCLCAFEEGEEGRLLPRCRHIFHTSCIDMWFHSHSTCPLCRSPVLLTDDPPPPFPHIPPSHHSPPPPPSSSITHPSSALPTSSPSSAPFMTRHPSSHYPSNILFWGDLYNVSSQHIHPPPLLFGHHHRRFDVEGSTSASSSPSAAVTAHDHLALDIRPWPWQAQEATGSSHSSRFNGVGHLSRSSSMAEDYGEASSSSRLKPSQSFRMSIRMLLSRDRSNKGSMRVFPNDHSYPQYNAEQQHHQHQQEA